MVLGKIMWFCIDFQKSYSFFLSVTLRSMQQKLVMVRLMSTDGGFLRAWTLKIPCHDSLDVFENQWLHHDFVQVFVFFFKVMSTKTKFPPNCEKFDAPWDILRPHLWFSSKVWPHLLDAEGFFVACFSKEGLMWWKSWVVSFCWCQENGSFFWIFVDLQVSQ